MDPVVFNPNQPKTETETNDNNVPVTVKSSESTPGGDTPTPPVTPLATETMPTPPLPPKDRKSKKSILIAILVLILLIAGGLFAYYKVNDMAEPTTSADQGKKDVEELRIGSDQFPFSHVYPNPNFATGGSFSVNLQVYEGLIGFENAEKHVPLLAESWTNPDDTTWEFKIKQGVKFHDGTVMTTEDVRRSIDNAVKDENTIQLMVSTIASVEAKDAETVVIKTNAPDAILLNKLPFLYIQGQGKLADAPVGTGAYHYDPAFTPTEKETRLVAFDQHHLGRPSVRKVTYQGFDLETDVQQAVKDGKVDITDFMAKLGSDPEDISGYQKQKHSVGEISFIGMNAKDPDSPLNKLGVRQAVQLALDPAAFIAKTNRSAEVPTQMTVKANVGFNPTLEAPKRDITKAKQLLTEAGYPNGVTLEYFYFTNDANTKAYEVLRDQFAEAGITLVDSSSEDSGAYFENLDSGKTQLYNLTVTSVFIDSYDIFAFNFRGVNFENSELNALLDESNTQFDANKRKATLQEASKIIMDQAAAVPLSDNTSFYYSRDNLSYKIDTVGFSVGGYIRTISGK